MNIWQSVETAALLEESNLAGKLDRTIAVIERWDHLSLLEARKFTREIKDERNELSPKQLKERIKASPNLRQSVILLMNYFNWILVSVRHDRVDIDILRTSLGRTAIDICDRFEPWIAEQPPAAIQDLAEFKKLLAS